MTLDDVRLMSDEELAESITAAIATFMAAAFVVWERHQRVTVSHPEEQEPMEDMFGFEDDEPNEDEIRKFLDGRLTVTFDPPRPIDAGR